MSYTQKQISNAINIGAKKKQRKEAVRKLTPDEKVKLIKDRFGLSHGGSKQNKKKRNKRRK